MFFLLIFYFLKDSFFYSLVYDPSNQTLLADKGRIEIGNRHQAIIPDLLNEKNKNDLETMECDDDESGNGGVEDDEEKMDDGIGNEEKNGHEVFLFFDIGLILG